MRPLPSPATGLPRLPVSPSLRAVPTTPADRNGCIRRLLPRSTRPSPNLRRVGVHIFTFEACSGFTRVRPARSLNRPRRPLSQGFGPAGYPTRPPVSYQIKPTTVWVDPSSTGVTRRRGALRNPGSRGSKFDAQQQARRSRGALATRAMADIHVQGRRLSMRSFVRRGSAGGRT